MLMDEEEPLKSSESGPSTDQAASSLEKDNTHRKVCFSFQRGYCKFGDSCKYAHVAGSDNKRRRRGNGDDYERIGGESVDRYGSKGDTSGGSFTEGGFQGNRSHRSVKQRKPASLVDKKAVADEPQIALAKQIIAKVGDMASISSLDELSSNITQLATILVDVGDLKVFPEEISSIFVRCMSALPVQSTVVSTVLALVYRKEASFPTIVVDKLEALLVHSLEINDIMTSKIILRSIASMTASNALSRESFFATLAVLHDRVLEKWPIPQGRGVSGEFPRESAPFLYLLASTIPCTVFQISGGEDTLGKCKILFDRFLEAYSSPYSVQGPYAVFQAYACPLDQEGNETTHEALGALHASGPANAACWDTLWESVHYASKLIASTDADIPNTLLRPWTNEAIAQGLTEEVSGELWDGSQRVAYMSLSEGFGHALKGVVIGSTAASSSSVAKCHEGAWLTPIFSLFDASTSPAAATCSSSLSYFERCTLTNYFRDIIHFFDPVINEDGTYVGSMQLMMTHLWAVGKHWPGIQSEALPTLLVETVFHKLMQIPRSDVRFSSTARLLLELCKKGETSHVQALGQGVHLLFNMIDEMDYCAYANLADWFATHLINTQLTWPYWSQWVSSVQEDNDGAFVGKRAFFCNMVVDKLSRQAMPQSVLPTLMGNEYLTRFLQNDGDDEVTVNLDLMDKKLVDELRAMIDSRVEDEEVFDFLDMAETEMKEVMLLQTLLSVSGNVPSSFISLINRYGETLRAFSSGKVGGSQLVESLWSSTSRDGELFLQYLDICLRRGVVTCDSAVDLLTTNGFLDTIDSNIWTPQLVFVVCDRALDIACTALATYPNAANVQIPSWENDDDIEEKDCDDATLIMKSAIRSVRRTYAKFITALLGSKNDDMATSCVRKICYEFNHREMVTGTSIELFDRGVRTPFKEVLWR